MHPDIVFRDGPSGRRAGVMGGPDVWEIAMWIDDLAAEGLNEAELVEDGVVTPAQIDAARAYWDDFPAEVAARIKVHLREANAAARR